MMIGKRKRDALLECFRRNLSLDRDQYGAIVFKLQCTAKKDSKCSHQAGRTDKVNGAVIRIPFFPVDANGAAFVYNIAWFAPLQCFSYLLDTVGLRGRIHYDLLERM